MNMPEGKRDGTPSEASDQRPPLLPLSPLAVHRLPSFCVGNLIIDGPVRAPSPPLPSILSPLLPAH